MSIPAIASAAPIATTAPHRSTEPSPGSPSSPAPSSPAAPARAGSLSAAGNSSTTSPLQAPPDQAGIQQALEEVREALAPVAQNLRFSLDEDSGRTVIKIVDTATDEVIRQIPSEEILAIAKALDKLQGVLIRQQA